MKTLIVEDDFTSRIILQSVLSEYGEAHIAVNGEEALKAFSMFKYDLICLDLHMPVMDGREVLWRIREIEASKGVHPGMGVKVFINSSDTGKETVFGAFNDACDEFLPKPLDPQLLIKRLTENRLI